MLNVGIDILDVERMEKLGKNDKFLTKYFTKNEIEYAKLITKSAMRLSGIYCAKEAFLKAVGIGLGGGINLIDIEIRHNEYGKPFIQLTTNATKQFKSLGFSQIEISISHTDSLATAICVVN